MTIRDLIEQARSEGVYGRTDVAKHIDPDKAWKVLTPQQKVEAIGAVIHQVYRQGIHTHSESPVGGAQGGEGESIEAGTAMRFPASLPTRLVGLGRPWWQEPAPFLGVPIAQLTARDIRTIVAGYMDEARANIEQAKLWEKRGSDLIASGKKTLGEMLEGRRAA